MLRPPTSLSPLIKAQMEKLTALTSGTAEPIFSSSTFIPKKPMRFTPSPNIFEPMQIPQNDDDDDDDGSLPRLPCSGQRLEHHAARDRIQLKNRRHTANERNTDHHTTLIVPQLDHQAVKKSKLAAPISLIDLTDLQTVSNNLRHRPRDRSVDNLPLSTFPLERSKRTESTTNVKIEEAEKEKENEDPQRPSSEHIYDNFDLFKRSTNPSVEELSTKPVPLRERPSARLRPVTMFLPNEREKPSVNELDLVFNQLKKRSSIRKVQPDRDLPRPIENQQVSTVLPPAERKKSIEPTPPVPSWIDIAKEKQTKLQSIITDLDSTKHSTNEEPTLQSPPETVPTSRTMKTGTPSRIHALIQFFNK